MADTPNTANPGRSAALAQRLGLAGFLFFLLKGLAWLMLPALLGLLR